MAGTKKEGRDVWLDAVMSHPHDSGIGKFKALGYWIARSIFETYGRVTAFQSAATLGAKAGMSRATSFRAMDTFHEEGFIGRKVGGGRGKVTTYWLELPSQCCDSLEQETVSAWERYCLSLREKLSQEEPETVSLLRLHIRLPEDSFKTPLKTQDSVIPATEAATATPHDHESEDGRLRLPDPDREASGLLWPEDSEMVPAMNYRHQQEDWVARRMAKIMATDDRGTIEHLRAVLGELPEMGIWSKAIPRGDLSVTVLAQWLLECGYKRGAA